MNRCAIALIVLLAVTLAGCAIRRTRMREGPTQQNGQPTNVEDRNLGPGAEDEKLGEPTKEDFVPKAKRPTDD